MYGIAFDSETTAASPGARLVQLAACVRQEMLEESRIIPLRCDLVNPGVPIPAGATAIHGITDEHLVTARTPADAIGAFVEAVIDQMATHPGAVLVAHNAAFDCSILQWEADAAGITIPQDWPVVCTLELARARGETKSNTLAAVCEYHGITSEIAMHDALGDATRTLLYWERVQATSPPGLAWGTWAKQRGFAYSPELPAGFEALPELIQCQGAITFDYVDAKGNATTRTLIPAGWSKAIGKPWISFHGFCLLKQDMREFRSDRVLGVQKVAF